MTLVCGEWNQLVGRTLDVRKGGKRLRTGIVEEVSSDASMLWLRFDGIHGCQIIMKTDAYDIFLTDAKL